MLMAHTARSKDDKEEFFDPPDELEKKVDLLAALIKKSKHFIVFTGAGVSTSTGIPDFRSGINTKLETGPGKWELKAHAVTRDVVAHKTTTTVKAIPSPTHMLLVKLQQEGFLKCVVSQNVDGLHRRSGIPKNALWELHGNNNMEKCKKCGHEYLRDFKCSRSKMKHLTGRNCDDPKCGGKLRDTIINFGESLPDDALQGSFEHAGLADLCIVFGSSLTVTPAADVPQEVAARKKSPGDLVIVNIQATPLDKLASIRIFAKCDDVSRLLAKKLSLDIPSFHLHRRLLVTSRPTGKGQKVEVSGGDNEGHPFSYIKQVTFVATDTISSHDTEPIWLLHHGGGKIKITIHPQGHYNEPNVNIDFSSIRGQSNCKEYKLEYDPHSRRWDVTEATGDHLAMTLLKQAKIN